MNKIKKYKELADDLTKLADIDVEQLSGYVIDELISITFEEPTNENLLFNKGIAGDDVKKGQYIYLTCLFRKKGTTSFSSPSIQGVIRCRVIDIFKGTQYLNKISNL